MHRSTSDITTTVSTTGTEAVAEAASAVARCADSATCGSEWAAGADAGSGTVAVICSRCGLTGLPFQGHHQRREAEWVGALVCLGVALALLMPGPTFSRPTFTSFGAVAPEGTWGMALLAVALIRMIGLWVNGSKRHSPSLRFVTATAGALLWGWMTWLLWNDGYPGVNTGCGAYGMLCLVDAYCAVRAVWDQGRNDARAAIVRRAAR